MSQSLEIVVHWLFFLILISAFFWIFARHLEAKRFNTEFSRFFKHIMKVPLTKLDVEERTLFTNIVKSKSYQNLKNYYAQNADPKTTKNNTQVAILNVIWIVVLIAILVLLIKEQKTKMSALLGIVGFTLFTYLFIGILEYLIFTRVILNYNPTPPSELGKVVVKTVKENLQ